MAQSIQEHAVALAVHLLTRQDGAEGGDQGGDTITVPLEGTAGHCAGSNDYDGRIGVRISAIFVILVTSLFGQQTLISVNVAAVLTGRCRHMVPRLRKATPRSRCTGMGLLHRKILRFRCYYCDGFHPCKFLYEWFHLPCDL